MALKAFTLGTKLNVGHIEQCLDTNVSGHIVC